MGTKNEWEDEFEDSRDEGDEGSGGDLDRLKSALAKERKERKVAEKQAKWYRLQSKHPSLTDEDEEIFLAAPTEQWDRLASRFSAAAETVANKETDPDDGDDNLKPDQKPEATRPAEEAARRMASIQGASAPVGTAPTVIKRDEAFRLMRKDPQKYAALKQQGLIDLGVEVVESGGTTRFRST